jgi:hypothetical protein
MPATSSESVFGEGFGEQALQLVEASGRTYPATLTGTFQTLDAQSTELRAKP